jgi:hypothetical protein
VVLQELVGKKPKLEIVVGNVCIGHAYGRCAFQVMASFSVQNRLTAIGYGLLSDGSQCRYQYRSGLLKSSHSSIQSSISILMI